MNRGNFALEGDDEMKRNCCGLRGRGFDDFSREDLRDIILHKNKVIADLEEHAYGSASWIENLNKGLKKANEIKRKVDKKSPKETDEEFKKRLEEFDKDKDAPTEAWGADELNGGMNLNPEDKKRAEELMRQTEQELEEAMRQQQQEMEIMRLQREVAEIEARRRALEKEKGDILDKMPTPPSSPRPIGRGGVPVSRPVQRDPPREPPQVRADGSNVGEILASALTPEQKTIIKNALVRANQFALGRLGWQDRMYPAELDRFVATFRQFIHPELLPVVDENMPLIRQIANMRPDLRENYIEGIVDDIGRSLNRAISSSGKKTDAVYNKIKGGAAPTPTPTKPEVSPVAAAAAVLKPVREKIQNSIGDAIYGKEDDPKKQRKGLLGISEEGKEESKKKVMKNIVVPIVKAANQLKTNIEDTANMIFNKDKYDADMKERRTKSNKKAEAEAGIVRDKENPSIIIRKPRGVWTAETSDVTEEAYNQKRQAVFPRKSPFGEGSANTKDVFYVRVPNPIFAAKLKPSMKEFSDAGIKLWTGVQQLNPKISEDVDGTLKQLQDDAFIFIPEENAKEIYAKLRQFVADKQDEEVATGFESQGWTKGELKQFAKIDPRTLKGQDLIDWKQAKLVQDRQIAANALDKVNKDIADEEAKAKTGYVIINNTPVKLEPDQAKLAKMREAKQRVLKRQQDLLERGRQDYKDMMMWADAEKRKRDAEYYARQAADAARPTVEEAQAQATEEVSDAVKEQAQGSVDLLQQAEVIGAEGGAKPKDPALYAKAKAIVNKSYPKHSAYRSGAYVKKYKEMGGEYEDEPDGKRPLARWFKEEWKDVGKKEYPVYRPTKRVSKETPLTPEEIDPENLKLQIKEKQKIRGERNLSAFKKRGGRIMPSSIRLRIDEDPDPVEPDPDPEEPEPEITEEDIILNDARMLIDDTPAVRRTMRYSPDGNQMVETERIMRRIMDYYYREDLDRTERASALAPLIEEVADWYNRIYGEPAFNIDEIEMEGEGGDDDDDDDDETENVEVIEVNVGKNYYLVDAPVKGCLPVGNYKKAIGNLFFGNRRVFDAETGDELGMLKTPALKKVAMAVLKKEEEQMKANLKKLGFARDEDTDGSSVASMGGGAKPVEMKQSDYYKEHKNIVKLLKNTGKSLLSEAKDQQEEATAMAKKLNAPDPFDDAEMVGAGAIEYTLTKAGKSLFNPSGDMSKAGRQSFTPDYDAYGDTVQDGKRNAFNLARSMYDQTKAIELPDFKLVRDDTSLRFYQKMDESVMLVGIRGTDVKSWTDLYTWAVIGANQDLRMTTRFQEDLAKLVSFQRSYPPSQFYYVATGSSLAGSIADRFLELGLIEEAITYNPSIEKKYVLEEGILNHRVYLDTDPLFMLMGQYAPNTEIRVNPNKTNFYNPSKEKDYLIASHSIYPIYNPAFEGGGMEGSGKTYTLEEWKAIFDAKLEEKRKAIEAREAKKKQTAKAKRERAKARRDARDEPPPLETPFRTSRTMKATPPKEPEPEEEEPEVEVEEYEMGDEIYLVEAPRKGLAFAERRVFDNDGEEIGKLTEDDVGKTLVKMVMRREKLGAFADKSPKAKSSSESLPFFESRQPVEEEEEEEGEDVEVSTVKYKGKEYDIEAPKGAEDMNLEFYNNREVWHNDISIGKLGDNTPLMKALMKIVIKDEFPSEKDYRETMGLEAKKPRASKAKAPASARVELREELVAEQPRNPAGEFAVAVARPRPMTGLPRMTAKQKEFFQNLMTRQISPTQKSILLARSGMSDKLIERLIPFIEERQRGAVKKQVGMITERVAEKRTDSDYTHLPADIKKGLRKLAQDIMNMKGRRPTMLDDSRRTDTLKKMTETERRQMLRRNFVAGVKSCEAIVSMTRTDMFGDYSCRNWEEGKPSYFKRVETSEYGVKNRCMAIGDEAGIPKGATLDQLKPVVGVGRDNAMMSSRMLCELSPSTWGVEDKPEAKFLSKGVPITKSTPDTDLAEYIRETQKIWRMCILKMLMRCGIDASIQKKINQSWKRGYGVVIFWDAYQGEKTMTKAKVREAQQEVDEKLSSPKLTDFLLDLRGFCAMVAEETEAEEEGELAQKRKDEEERIYLRRVASEMTPDEEEEKAKVRANPDLKAKLWAAIRKEQNKLQDAFGVGFSGDLRQRLNRMKRIAGIDYNTGYGSVAPFSLSASQKAKLPPLKKDGYYPSAEEYIRDMEKR